MKMNERNHERQGICGTPLLYSGELKLWGGHESEEALHAAQGTTPPTARQMAEESRWQRLLNLQGAMAVKRCYSPPPKAEADQWIAGLEDVDDEHGRTIQWGIPVWTPKAESDEWHRLRFAVNPDDSFVGSLAGRTTKVATIEEINAATAQGWAGKK